ncbi:hypothetical protein [Paenibacillus sanfengchensis]|uniref:hypothetical protein n=1 Tax=Paenibacillus sanfengchensis TaxID=3119819 RepID=UPI002FE07010
MSLSDWLYWLRDLSPAAITASLALALFLGLYGVSALSFRRREQARLRRLDASLKLYAAAESALIHLHARTELSQAEERLLLDRLLACRAAPYLSEDAMAQISTYAGERDLARLPRLLKTLERENDRMCAERDKLLRHTESPGWGQAFWRQVRPGVPFLFAAALLYLFSWLLRALNGEIAVGNEGEAVISAWSLFGSALFSLALLYPVVMGGNRPGSGAVLHRLWSVLISALFLLHLVNPSFAPFVLTLQLLLFLAGFRLTGTKPRKSRPFAGHYQALPEGQASLSTETEPETAAKSPAGNDTK